MSRNFDRAILSAEDRAHFKYGALRLADCTRAERKLARALVRKILGASCRIGVLDGEEMVLAPTSRASAILNAMYTTGRDVLVLNDAEDRTIGWFELVYGNGHEVIADHADNDICNSIADSLHPLSNRIAASH